MHKIYFEKFVQKLNHLTPNIINSLLIQGLNALNIPNILGSFLKRWEGEWRWVSYHLAWYSDLQVFIAY